MPFTTISAMSMKVFHPVYISDSYKKKALRKITIATGLGRQKHKESFRSCGIAQILNNAGIRHMFYGQ